MITNKNSEKFSDPVQNFKIAVLNNLEHHIGKGQETATDYDNFLSVAYAVTELLCERWIVTQQRYKEIKPKRVYYLSMEVLMGRTLGNALINLDIEKIAKKALLELGMKLEEVEELERDAGLGNGGLGRLAACFLDSLATLDIPALGYGINYNFGLFNQEIIDGKQVEKPDNWLSLPSPWQFERPEYSMDIYFGGYTSPDEDQPNKKYKRKWYNSETVLASAVDIPIPGYDTTTVGTLRLWNAQAFAEFDLNYFNSGDYMMASQTQVLSETISKVLYPSDTVEAGKELRLKQEYFLVSASVQDIVRRFKQENGDNILSFGEKVAIQLNDTHPALAIPELMRIFVDEENLEWHTAWDICTSVFGYTNHTILPEALEEWTVFMMTKLLPRHMEIIYLINHYFMLDVQTSFPGDLDRMKRMSIIAEDNIKRVRMSHLAVVGSHAVNGVAEIHSNIIRNTMFKDFYQMNTDKFFNITNGVTPRRWIKSANPELSELITEAIGEKWIKNLSELSRLEHLSDDKTFQDRWREVKRNNKVRLCENIAEDTGILVFPDTVFDVQVKRIHEYKRQLLFALYIISQYIRLKDNEILNIVPRTCLISGKAAPSYTFAKLIIRFISRIAELTQRDLEINPFLNVAFLPNYRVSLAEKIIPAADLSEQLSTAGTEASGTGNMKFALNGAITIGTMDGANVEIYERVGNNNIFIFGNDVKKVEDLRRSSFDPKAFIERSELLQRVLHLIDIDFFSPSEHGLFKPIYNNLTSYDFYQITADFDSYVAAQDKAAEAYLDETRWAKMSILNTARSGYFSSDRTTKDYTDKIWHVNPINMSDM